MLAHPCTARLTAPLLLSLALLASTLPGAARADDSTGLSGWQPGPDAPLELSRYMGRWYVVARVANPVERGHVGSFHDYTLDGDQRVRIQYHFRESFDQPLQVMPLRARVDDHSGNRRWRTWFYKVVPTRTEVLEIADDYSWALVGYPGRDMAWVMAREPQMSQATYYALSEKLADHGFNTDRMRRVLHEPDQVQRLGFETARRN